ncbi:flippase-like domain-containing protein [Sphingobacterium sp. ML3W]|uniref:lysylphosphatidylglycerol synthase transmembrane domain-containing protein n=1 Tax=Sphingobacterium sp. ML3W TaxID=1538644 RepID=UPI00249ACCE8|nr:lysylphosphatidylglycerol synthase transmembrane domain-containing protein [Sphingobacterium sp. ML3W]WFA81664.1 flippase-like domain-containing protein [Sphingobacterium sp. ML3W]
MGKLITSRQLIKAVFLLLILTSMVIFVIHSDLSALKKELSTIGYRFIFIVFTTLVAYLFGTLAWWVCLGSSKKKINILELFAVRQIGETVGLFNPTSIIAGDLLKAELITRYDIPLQPGLSAVAISRITAILSQLSIFLLAMIWLMLSPLKKEVMQYTGYAIYVVCVVLLLFVILIFYWLVSTKIPPKNNPADTSFVSKSKNQLQKLLWDTKDFYQQQNKVFWYSYLLFAIHWLIGSLEFYLILKFLAVDVRVIHGLILDMSVILFKSAGAFIPGQLGVEEISNKLLLSMIGISGGSIWLSVSLLRRGRQVFWTAIGAIFYLCIKRKTVHVSI